MVAYMAWKDFYTVGDEALDAQHKQIFGIINELYNAMQRGDDYRMVKPSLERLVQYTLTHFKDEEIAMAATGYPDFAQHKALHDKMRRKTVALLDNANLVTCRDLLVLLKDWWVGHIQGCDKQYAPYLKDAAVAHA